MALYEIIKTDWGSVFPKLKQQMIEHAPQILAGVGVTSLVTAGIIAVKNTPAACEAIEDKKAEENIDKLSFVDILKVGAKYYAVPAGMTLFGATCIMESVAIGTARTDAFAALAASQALRIKDQNDVIREKFGEKKAKEVEEEVAKRTVDREFPEGVKEIEETGHGEQMVYWPLLGRWFKCDIGWIRRVVNDINKEIKDGDANPNDPFDTKTLSGVSLNRFLVGCNLRKCHLGMLLGWNGENYLRPRFYDPVTEKESEKAVVLFMNMDDCMPTTKWDTVRQNAPVRVSAF